MKTEVKEWWLGLADWYERVADGGPCRVPTCFLLTDDADFGFSYIGHPALTPFGNLRNIWQYWGDRSRIDINYPCGDYDNPADEVAAKRQEFCYWMAETIRDAVERGVYPWGDKD